MFTTKNTLSTVIMVSYQKKNFFTRWTTCFTMVLLLQQCQIHCAQYKIPHFHSAKTTLYMEKKLSTWIYTLHNLVSPTCVLCLVSGVLCIVSCVLCLVPCVLCLVSCVLCLVFCVLCLVSCVFCLVSCV